jgi:hypothetical protein
MALRNLVVWIDGQDSLEAIYLFGRVTDNC